MPDFTTYRTVKLIGYINCALRQVDPNYDRIDAASAELSRRG